MSLGAALAIVGALLLVLLAVHGWWTTRHAAPRRASGDTLPGERVEPHLPGLAGEVPVALDDDEPAASAAGRARAALRAGSRPSAQLDALIDALVPLTLDAPVSGDFVMAHLPPTRRAGSKPFYIEGLDVDSGRWEAPAPGRRYGELQAGVQLGSRAGAINEIEYSEFVQKVQAFADAIGASPDAPDMLEVVARARQLDAITTPLDVQLTLRLRTRGVAWSVAFVQQAASRHGFVAGAMPGRWVLPGDEDGAPPVLVLAVDALAALDAPPMGAAVRECTLTLDVPQTAEAVEPFPAWHRAATQLAEALDAEVIDDGGQPVTLHAFASIGNDLAGLYRRLEAIDLAAGSAAARRWFS